jgi:hypothetical protein
MLESEKPKTVLQLHTTKMPSNKKMFTLLIIPCNELGTVIIRALHSLASEHNTYYTKAMEGSPWMDPPHLPLATTLLLLAYQLSGHPF